MNHFQKVSWKKIIPIALIFLFLVSSFSASSSLPSAYASGQSRSQNSPTPKSIASPMSAPPSNPDPPTSPSQLTAYGFPPAYFGMMSQDGTISTLESNYPSWNTYQSGSVSTSSLSVNIDAGLDASVTASSGSANEGLVNSQLLSLPSSGQGETISFQMMSGQEAHVVFASTYVTSTDILSSSQYLDFCVCENIPQIRENSASNVLWSGSQSGYAAWTVRIGPGGVGLTAFVDTGTGWTEVYNSLTLDIGFNYGYLYAFSRSSSSTSTAMLGYLNVWNPNNPLVEGTLDQNVWYLVRHYESVNSFSYGVMLDTSVPPLWMSIPVGAYTADMYVGMTLGGLGNECQGNPCNVVQGVLSTNGSLQTDAYLFCYGGDCSSSSLQSAEAGGSLSSQEVAYVTVETSPSATGGSEIYNVSIESSTTSFTLNFGTVQIFVDSGSAGSGSYQATIPYGLPGLRYVSRHVTEVSGLLFQELGYNTTSNNWASPLENFIPTVLNACSTDPTCKTPYVEYYSPLFPSAINELNLASNWYYQENSWPGYQFYSDLPDAQGTSFGFPVFGNQWSEPYISRMSLTTAPLGNAGGLCNILANVLSLVSCNAQNLWMYGVQKYGYDPTSLALRAMLAAEQGQSASTVGSLLTSAGWDGFGVSKNVRFFGVPYTEPSYATYETAAFAAAASAAGNIEGNAQYSTWAAQAAGALESALWSGTGHIAGQTNPVTLWQYAGGEMSAYNPSPAVLTYASNQGGAFGAVSVFLQQIGYQGVQPAESPGFEPVATEATALSAIGLLDYLSYLGNQPAQHTNQGPFLAADSSVLDATTSCAPNSSYCTSDTAISGQVSFKTVVGGTFTADLQQPITISQPVTSSNWQAGFWIDGSIIPSGSLTVRVNLMDPVTGDSITGYSTTVSASQSYNQYVQVGGLYPLTLAPGSYLEQFIISGQGSTDFYDSGGFVQPLFLYIVPNTIQDNFVQDPYYTGWWNDYATSNASPCSITQGGDGLLINTASGNLASSACGIGSQSAVTSIGGNFMVQASTSISSNAIGSTIANVLITPSLLGDGIENGGVGAGTLVSSSNNYIMLQEVPSGTGYEPAISYCGSGTCSSYTGSSTSTNSTDWLVTFNPVSGDLNVETNTGSGYQQFYSTTSLWGNATSAYVYLYGSATSNSEAEAAFQGVSLQGTSYHGLASNTGDVNQFTTTGNPPSTTFFNFGTSSSSPSYLSSNVGTDFNTIQTVSFWMAPQTTGGNNPSGTGSSTFVVSNVEFGDGCCAGWAIEYYNTGTLGFDYSLGGNWQVATSTQTFPPSSGPYFVSAVYNPSTNYIYLYVNGALVASKSTTGSPYAAMPGQLIIGASPDCASGDVCYGGYLSGTVYGLTISTDTPASQQQVTQMMQYQAGDPVGSAYWYPLENSNAADRYGVGPILNWNGNGGVVSLLYNQEDPYLVPASTWTPYFSNGASNGNPYYTSVDTSNGSPPTSFTVYENNASSQFFAYGGFATQIDASLWNPSNGMVLSFDYRATSSYSGGSQVTNFYLQILGSSGQSLYSNLYTASNTGDSGWNSFSLNIGSYVSGQQRITVFLGIDNGWSANWHQKDWFDNLRIYVPSHPSSSALQLYKQNSLTFQSNGYMTLPWYSPPSGAFTVSVWFEPQTVNPGDNPRIIANDHTDSNNHGFQIYMNNGGGTVNFDVGSGGSSISLSLAPTGGLENYAFYNAQMTYDTTSFCAYLYNSVGVLLASGCDNNVGSGYSLSSGQYPVWIGENPQYQGDQFPGTVSDIRIFTYALSGAQSQALATDGPLSYSFAPNSIWLPLSGSFQDQVTGLYAFPVNTNSMQFISEASQPSQAVQLNVVTELLNGTQINGYYTVIRSSSGTILDTGFSPFVYPATSGNTYKVQVDNYGNCAFSNWAGGSTSDPITVQPSETMTLVAYYTCT